MRERAIVGGDEWSVRALAVDVPVLLCYGTFEIRRTLHVLAMSDGRRRLPGGRGRHEEAVAPVNDPEVAAVTGTRSESRLAQPSAPGVPVCLAR
jgi:hypothetical protein